jgi:hypothetical protein
MTTSFDITTLSGYQNMTPAQRFVLELTLFHQKFANQGIEDSQRIVNPWPNHASVLAVESGVFDSQIIPIIPSGHHILEGDSHIIGPDHTALENYLRQHQAPFVVLMFKLNNGGYLVYHSLIALGDGPGGYYLWEKRSYDQPFRLTRAQELFYSFPGFSWGVRNFKYHTLDDILNDTI